MRGRSGGRLAWTGRELTGRSALSLARFLLALQMPVDSAQHAHHRFVDGRIGVQWLAPFGELSAQGSGMCLLDTHTANNTGRSLELHRLEEPANLLESKAKSALYFT